MRLIPLTRGYIATVDDDDFAALSRITWHAHTNGRNTVYARNSRIFMHRLILNDKKGQFVDHSDGNTLNNCRSNLRLCTTSDNSRNRRKTRGQSRFKGVCRQRKKWNAAIHQNGRLKHLGNFILETDAALAYDKAARQLFGEFAAVNFPANATERCCLSILSS